MKTLLFAGQPTLSTLTSAYDRAAATWHRNISRIGFIDAYGELLEACLNDRCDRADRSVLDAGCGTAAFSLAYARQNPNSRFDLLDVSAQMLELGVRHLNEAGFKAGRICCDVSDLAKRRTRYDAILSAHLIEHCDSPHRVLSALFSALRPGGQLIMVVSKPHWCTALVRLRWGHRAYRPATMAGLLDAAGFSRIDVHKFSAGPPRRLSAGYIATRPQENVR